MGETSMPLKMIFTARQIEQLWKGNGHVTLPYRARLSPMAQDFVRQNKIAVGYSDADTKAVDPISGFVKTDGPKQTARPLLWWADGPCGPAKAALMSMEKEANLQGMLIPSEPKKLTATCKELAGEIKA